MKQLQMKQSGSISIFWEILKVQEKKIEVIMKLMQKLK